MYLFYDCRVHAHVTAGNFFVSEPFPTGWTHVVINYISQTDGIRLFQNGVQTGSSSTTKEGPYPSGEGRVIVGRFLTDVDNNYPNADIDELLFFNQILSNSQISGLVNMV